MITWLFIVKYYDQGAEHEHYVPSDTFDGAVAVLRTRCSGSYAAALKTFYVD